MGAKGIIAYSIFICVHPIIILVVVFKAFKMGIHTFERANEKKKENIELKNERETESDSEEGIEVEDLNLNRLGGK